MDFSWMAQALRAPALNSPVGNNRDNEDDDVHTVRVALERLGVTGEDKAERDHTGRPLGIITAQMDQDIRRFQRDNDLKEDGLVNPGGETITKMKEQLRSGVKENSQPPARTFLTHLDDDDLVNELVTNEGGKEHFYKDSKGYVTTGAAGLRK